MSSPNKSDLSDETEDSEVEGPPAPASPPSFIPLTLKEEKEEPIKEKPKPALSSPIAGPEQKPEVSVPARSAVEKEKDHEHAVSEACGSSQQEEPNNLIVNYLPNSLTEDNLRALFVPFGNVIGCKLMMDKNLGTSLGYGFVKFETAEAASAAMRVMTGYVMEGKTLKVSYARPASSDIRNANLYVAGMEPQVSKADLELTFSKYGSIIEAKILTDPKTGLNRGAGFVRFSSRAEADVAMKSLNGTVLPGLGSKALVVKFAEGSEEKSRKYISKTLAAARFGPNGGINYAAPPLLGVAPPGYPYSGYAYSAQPQSPTAASRMQQAYAIVPPQPLSQSSAQNVGMLPMGTMGALGMAMSGITSMNPYLQMQMPMQMATGVGGGITLFVYNLTADADDSLLYRMFGPFGAVVNVKIIRDKDGRTKGYGFVTMSRAEEAQRAITALNGAVFNGKTLQVRFRQAKTDSGTPF